MKTIGLLFFGENNVQDLWGKTSRVSSFHRTRESLRTSFLDCTEDLFEEMFSKEVEPENVLVLTCYQGLKEDGLAFLISSPSRDPCRLDFVTFRPCVCGS